MSKRRTGSRGNGALWNASIGGRLLDVLQSLAMALGLGIIL